MAESVTAIESDALRVGDADRTAMSEIVTRSPAERETLMYLVAVSESTTESDTLLVPDQRRDAESPENAVSMADLTRCCADLVAESAIGSESVPVRE